MNDEGREVVVGQTRQDVATLSELSVGELQDAILQEALKRVKDPQAVRIVLPNALGFDRKRPEDYEGGAEVGFVLLDNSKKGGDKDQVCIALVDNKDSVNPVSMGYGFFQAVRNFEKHDGTRSQQEIAITRMTQTQEQQAQGIASFARLSLSDTVANPLGRVLINITTSPDDSGGRELIERWQDGSIQLAEAGIYAGKVSRGDATNEFTRSDFVSILESLKNGTRVSGLERKIVREEEKMMQAREVTSRRNVSPRGFLEAASRKIPKLR